MSTLAWEKPEALSKTHSLMVEAMNRAQEGPERQIGREEA